MDLSEEDAAFLNDDERAVWERVKFSTGSSDLSRDEARALVKTILGLRRSAPLVHKREWVDCPVCGCDSMSKTWESGEDDGPYIHCTNIACASNGGDNAEALLLRVERQKSTAPFVVGDRVKKVRKGYRFRGVVIMTGFVSDGEVLAWRFGVRNDDGILMIFSASDLAKDDE